MEATAQRLLEAASTFVAEHPENALVAHGGMRIYDAPLMAVADAGDPLFERLQDETVVGPHHRLPREWLCSARRVVSFFLPFTLEVRRTNRGEGLPSEEWTSARIDGEAFNQTLREYLRDLIRSWGQEAVIPPLEEGFAISKRRANWSERHVAFVAGLGTFGLSSSFITARGSAGRLGSLVTSLLLPVTDRKATGIYDFCLWHQGGRCRQCMDRCPAGAISEAGKDVALCANYLDEQIRPRFWPRYGCAKCQVGVLCEECAPQAAEGSTCARI